MHGLLAGTDSPSLLPLYVATGMLVLLAARHTATWVARKAPSHLRHEPPGATRPAAAPSSRPRAEEVPRSMTISPRLVARRAVVTVAVAGSLVLGAPPSAPPASGPERGATDGSARDRREPRQPLEAERARGADLQARLDAVTAQASELQDALAAADARVTRDASTAATLKARIAAAKKRLATLNASIEAAARRAAARPPTVVTRIVTSAPATTPRPAEGQHDD